MKDTRTDTELNRIIAEWHLGYQDFDELKDHFIPPRWSGQKLFGAPRSNDNWFIVPNYCTDLNAIREAVEKLPEGPYTWWSNHLMQLCGTHLKSVNAGPRERAEALVAVIEGGIK